MKTQTYNLKVTEWCLKYYTFNFVESKEALFSFQWWKVFYLYSHVTFNIGKLPFIYYKTDKIISEFKKILSLMFLLLKMVPLLQNFFTGEY